MFALQKQNVETFHSPLLWDSVATVSLARPRASFKLARSIHALKADKTEPRLLEKEAYCCDRATD